MRAGTSSCSCQIASDLRLTDLRDNLTTLEEWSMWWPDNIEGADTAIITSLYDCPDHLLLN